MQTKKWKYEHQIDPLDKLFDASYKIIEAEYPHTPVAKLPISYGGAVEINGINVRNLQNAKLIAAAPGLFDCLKSILGSYQGEPAIVLREEKKIPFCLNSEIHPELIGKKTTVPQTDPTPLRLVTIPLDLMEKAFSLIIEIEK